MTALQRARLQAVPLLAVLLSGCASDAFIEVSRP